MASKGLKLIQNGVITYAPNTPAVRAGIEGPGGHNQKTKKSRSAAQEHITILEATEEEVEQFLYPKVTKRNVEAPGLSLQAKLEKLEAENSELKTMMLNFMAAQQNNNNKSIVEKQEPEERRRPGRPTANTQ